MTTSWRRPGATGTAVVRGPVVLGAVAGLLAAAAVLSLWLAHPPAGDEWMPIWELVGGAGFAAAGLAVRTGARADPGGWRLWSAGLLLLAAVPLSALGWPALAHVAPVVAMAVVVPLALLRIVRPRPAPLVMRGLEVLIGLAGAVAVAATLVPLTQVALGAGLTVAVAVAGAGWVQFELTRGDARRQVLWLVLGVSASVPTALLFLVAIDTTDLGTGTIAIVVSVLSLFLPLTAAVALVDPRVVDVRAVISQAVVMAVMLALTVAVYRGVEAGAELLTDGPGLPGGPALLAALIAVGFHPVMLQVRSSVDEILFGGRPDPMAALTRLGSQLTAGTSPEEWLDTLRRALVVPGVVLVQGTETIARSGRFEDPTTVVTELHSGAEHVGDLVVTLPADQLRLGPGARAVLSLVAAPLAQALHAIRLSEQVQASRGRVVVALEEERRRVRRDLHDGLGPTLTGIAYSADAAANLVEPDPGQAIRVLHELRADAGEAIAEIRRIVYGLRPKALDELGLVGAVRQRVSHLRAAGGEPLTVLISAPEQVPELAAAVEVAAYRTAVEAVTNVARHAGVQRATLDFEVLSGTTLRISVRDAGRSEQPWRPGVGLESMRERVEQIGGVLTLEGGMTGGTVVADLPLTLPSSPEDVDRPAD